MFIRTLFFDVLVMLLFLPNFFFLFLVLVLRKRGNHSREKE